MAIDQGTTSSRAIIFNKKAEEYDHFEFKFGLTNSPTSIVSSFVSLSIYLLFIEEIIYFCFFKSFLADLVNIIFEFFDF